MGVREIEPGRGSPRRRQSYFLKQVTALNRLLTRSQLLAVAEMLQNPWRVFLLNFLSGLARGFGTAVGLTLVAGAFLVLLTRLASLNLPVIGRFIAEIVRLVNFQLRDLPR